MGMRRESRREQARLHRNELTERHAIIQELTSQNYMNDSREFQDFESICSGKLSHVPSQRAVVPSLCGIAEPATKVCNQKHGICLVHRERVWQSTCSKRFVIDALSRNASLLASKVLQAKTQYEKVQGNLSPRK